MNAVHANGWWSGVSGSPTLAAAVTGIYVSTFYIMGNTTMLPAMSVLVILLALTLPISFSVAVVNGLLRRIRGDSYIGFVSLFICALYLLVVLRVPVFSIRSVSAFRSQFEGIGWFLVHVVIFLTLAAVIAYTFHRNLGKYMIVLTAMSLAAVALGIATPAVGDATWRATHVNKSEENPYSIELAQNPNIYLVVADGYGSFAFMQDNHIDVSTFRKTLQEMNFRLYDEVFSNYHSTNPAMLAMLNMEHHYYFTTFNASEIDKKSRAIIAGRNNLTRLLTGNGYRTEYIHQGDYLLLHGCTADYCYPRPSSISGARNVLRKILPSAVKRMFPAAKLQWQKQPREKISEVIVGLTDAGTATQNPLFRYIHMYEPGHTPNEVAGACDEKAQLEAYSRRIESINLYLSILIESINDVDPSAVIVVAGDHGPFITQRCQRNVDLGTLAGYRDRAGSLLAIRWPGDYHGQYDLRIKTTVNLFRYVLASLADTPTAILSTIVPDNVYIRGTDGVLQIVTNGDITIPPKMFDGIENQEEESAE